MDVSEVTFAGDVVTVTPTNPDTVPANTPVRFATPGATPWALAPVTTAIVAALDANVVKAVSTYTAPLDSVAVDATAMRWYTVVHWISRMTLLGDTVNDSPPDTSTIDSVMVAFSLSSAADG